MGTVAVMSAGLVSAPVHAASSPGLASLPATATGRTTVEALTTGSRYVSLTPARLYDSRPGTSTVDGVGVGAGAQGPASVRTVQVLGRGGVPATGVEAVVLHLTSAQASTQTFVSAWSSDQAQPVTSVFNPGPTGPDSNLVIVPVGPSGTVSLFNSVGSLDLIVDVQGWFPTGSSYEASGPARVFDTRATAAPLGPDGVVDVQVAGVGGVPSTGVGSVVMNVTAVDPTDPSYLTVYPAGTPRTDTSNLNTRPGRVSSNLVVAQPGADGKVSVYNRSGSTQLIVDVLGWFGAGPDYVPLKSARVLDTRSSGPVGPGSTIQVPLAGVAGVPATGAGTVVVNLTAPSATDLTYLTVYPTGMPRPVASDLNPRPGWVGANSIFAKLGPDGSITIFNETGSVEVIVDVVGWLPSSAVAADDAATIVQDASATTIDVLANDTDPAGGSKVIESVTQPANGTTAIVGAGSALSYQPDAGYCNNPPGSAPDVFTYSLVGGATATVSVTVECADEAPVAVADSATVTEDAAATAIDVLANDTDVDGGPMLAVSVTQPANGSVMITGGGTGLTYRPDAGYCNNPPGTTTDDFTYTLNGGSSATVSVTVDCANLPPAITGGPTAAVDADENQTAVTDVDSTDSQDSEGSGLTYSLTGGTDVGFFSIDPDAGVLTFTTAPDFEAFADADGDNGYEVQVTVTDSGGLTDFQDITVTLGDVNDAPVVTTSAGTTAFTEAGGAVTVDGAVTVVDQDGGSLASATVTITNLFDGADEALAATTGGTSITASYAAGTLTLTGPDTIANFQTVLQSVTYSNASLDPDQTDRVVRIVVNDGTVDSNNGDKTVSVSAVNSPPTAVDDAYTVPINVRLDAGTGTAGIDVNDADGVLTKGTDDSDPEGTALLVTGIVGCGDATAPFTNCATTGGGVVTMNADGTFTYVSQPGETAATDTFEYVVSDGGLTGTATVTITLGETIWFIDASASAGGNGTSPAPFNTITAFNDTAVDQAGDTIYVNGGTYTDAEFRLLPNQRLIGATIGLTSGNLTIAPSGGAAPTISSNSGAIVILLSTNNTVRGFTSAGSAGAGSIVGNNVGTPVIDNFTINGPGALLDIVNGNLTNVVLGSMTSTSSNADGIRLDNVSGTFTVGSPVVTSAAANHGIRVVNSSATIHFSSTVDVNNSGTAGVLLTSNTGTITFADLDVTNSTSNQSGITATGGGTLNITTGTVNAGTASAVDINGVTLGVTLSSVNSSGGTAPGIELRSTAGSFTANGGTIANKAGGDVAAGAKSVTGEGIGVYIDTASNVTLSGLTINGTIQNFGIRGFGLSGTTNFTNLVMNGTYGNNASSGEGTVALDEVTGTLDVTGGAYGGGHEDVFAVNTSSGTLNANVTGVAINASQATTGDNGMQFRTLNSGSATLHLSVQGSAFNAAGSVMLFVDVAGTGGGTVNIGGTTANTFTQGQTNAPGGGAILVFASGIGNTATVTTTIANNTITAGSATFEGNVIVSGTGFAHAGTHNLTISSNQIGASGVNGSAVNPASFQGDTGIFVSQKGTSTMNVLISNNSVFDYNDAGIGIRYDAEGSATPPLGGTMNLTMTDNTITGETAASGDAVEFRGFDDVDVCADVRRNSLAGAPGQREIDVASGIGASGASTFTVPGLSTLTEPGIEALWAANNGGLVPNTDVRVSVLPSTIQAGSSCPTP